MFDPFHRHPELRAQVGDPAQSPLRDLDLARLDRQVMEAGHPPDWRRTDEDREATRRNALHGVQAPIWVFAYGSLMWNPSMLFDEVRVAEAPGHARHFCLWDDGGRGSRDVPGLQAALDTRMPDEPACHGLAFRIPAEHFERETELLWRREMIAWGYRAEFIGILTAPGPLTALAFLADHAAATIRRGLLFEQQAQMISVASGLLGPNHEYLESLCAHLDLLDLADPPLFALRDRVRQLRQGDTGA